MYGSGNLQALSLPEYNSIEDKASLSFAILSFEHLKLPGLQPFFFPLPASLSAIRTPSVVHAVLQQFFRRLRCELFPAARRFSATLSLILSLFPEKHFPGFL